MNITDPISDLLVRIRNAISVGHETVDIPASRLKLEVVKILKEQRLIENYKMSTGLEGEKGMIRVVLRDDPEGQPAIRTLQRISRPGCRVYLKRKGIMPVLNGFGISILSTSRGVMTGARAIEEGVGGEILCNIC